MASSDEDWENAAAAPSSDAPVALVLDLDGYEGPIDVLLALARQQKVDLTRISILQLAEQYLTFIVEARRLSLEIAAEYLVMAAWLVYLKSRLLLPEEEAEEDEPSGPELAEALTFQLRRLQAMQETGQRLMARPRLGQDVFSRGDPEGFEVVRTPVYEVSLFDLLSAYGENQRRTHHTTLTIQATNLFSTAEAVERLSGLIGAMVDWRSLMTYLPKSLAGPLERRSAIASTFAASLELARSGRVELRQATQFGPVYVRALQRSASQVGDP